MLDKKQPRSCNVHQLSPKLNYIYLSLGVVCNSPESLGYSAMQNHFGGCVVAVRPIPALRTIMLPHFQPLSNCGKTARADLASTVWLRHASDRIYFSKVHPPLPAHPRQQR